MVVSVCQSSPTQEVAPGSRRTITTSGSSITVAKLGWMKIGPKRRANALCCATSISWSRKNTTQCSFSASRISPTVPLSSALPTSTPKISAPPAPEIGFTSIRLFFMACSYSAVCYWRRSLLSSAAKGSAASSSAPQRSAAPITLALALELGAVPGGVRRGRLVGGPAEVEQRLARRRRAAHVVVLQSELARLFIVERRRRQDLGVAEAGGLG